MLGQINLTKKEEKLQKFNVCIIFIKFIKRQNLQKLSKGRSFIAYFKYPTLLTVAN